MMITAPSTQSRSLKDPRELAAALLVTGLFVAISFWFHIHDVHNKHFSDSGSVYFTYNLLKFASAAYLMWILYFIGHVILEALSVRGYEFSLTATDRAISAFYIGSSALAIVMYLLGYLHLYYFSVSLVITVPIVFLSYPQLSDLLATTQRGLSAFRLRSLVSVRAVLVGMAAIMLLTVLIDKALFPTFDYDSLTHYLQYYREVIHNHSLAPNNVWYHFYYSKGAGLFYLNMLLTDDMGLSIVSFLMTLATALVLYSLSKKMTDNVDWGIAVVITYLCTLPFNYEVIFEKQHVFMTSLFAGISFFIITMPRIPAHARWAWTALLAGLLVHLAIFAPTAVAFVSPLLLITHRSIILFVANRTWRENVRIHARRRGWNGTDGVLH